MTNYRLKKQKAFTLAEVLVTLAVIGIVASLTVPALVKSLDNHKYSSRVLKVHSALSSATNMIMADNGGSLIGLFTGSNDMRNKYMEKMKQVKICISIDSDCWHADGEFYTLDGRVWFENDYNNSGNLISVDGVLYHFRGDSASCTRDYSDGSDNQFKKGCGWIAADTNGFSGPNRIGVDIHRFFITQQGLYPFGTEGSAYNVCDKNDTTSNINGSGCVARILKTRSMDHLK